MTYIRTVDQAWLEDSDEVARIVKILTDHRVDNNLSQTDLGLNQSTVSRIETLRTELYITNLMRYARTLGYRIVMDLIPLEPQSSTSPGR